MRNEITVYKMFCTNGRVNGECKSEEQTANPTTYKVFPDLQSVVYWIGDGPPSRFTNCAVRDVSNWTCHLAKEPPRTEYMMTDGNFVEYAEAPMIASTTLFYPVFGTAFGMSDADVEVTSHQLDTWFENRDARAVRSNIKLENKLTSAGLFDNYARSLSGGD